MEKPPFIYKFKTQNGRYVYDVNSNRILKVDAVEYDLIDDYRRLARKEIHSKWGDKCSAEDIDQTLDSFDDGRAEGYLSANRPRRFLPAEDDYVDDQLSTKMQQLLLNITEICNLRCRYCVYSGSYQYERRHSTITMAPEIARKAVRDFWEHSREREKVHISFYGGEPLVAFDLIRDTVDYARRLGEWPRMFLHVDTNGTLLTDAMIKYFVDNKFYLQISLDGPREMHDRYRIFRNGKGTFDRIMTNLRKIREMDPEYYMMYVSFACTLVPPYDLERLNDFFSSPPFERNAVNLTLLGQYDTTFFEDHARGIESKLEPTYYKLRDQYIDARIKNGTPSNFVRALIEQQMTRLCRRGFSPMNGSVHPNGICLPGGRRVFVSVDGNYYPCERVLGDDFKIGDVDHGVEPDRVKNLIKNYVNISTPDCFSCWAVRLCRMCYSMARKGPHMDRNRKRTQCFTERQNMHEALVTYMEILERNPDGFDFVKDMVFE